MDIEPSVSAPALDLITIAPRLDRLPPELVLSLAKCFDDYRDVERFSTLNRRIRGIVKANRHCLSKGWMNLEISRQDTQHKELFCSISTKLRYDPALRICVNDGEQKYPQVYDTDQTPHTQQQPVSTEFKKILSTMFASMNINELRMWNAPRDVMDLVADLKREHRTIVRNTSLKFHIGCCLLPGPSCAVNLACDLVSSPDPIQTTWCLLYFAELSQISEELFHMTELKKADRVEVYGDNHSVGPSPIPLSYGLLSQYRATKLVIRCPTNLDDDDVYHIIKDVVTGTGRATFPGGWSLRAPLISIEAIISRFPTATAHEMRHPHEFHGSFHLYTIPYELPEVSAGTDEKVRRAEMMRRAQSVLAYYAQGQVCINKKPCEGLAHF